MTIANQQATSVVNEFINRWGQMSVVFGRTHEYFIFSYLIIKILYRKFLSI